MIIDRRLDEGSRFQERYGTSHEVVLLDLYGLWDTSALDQRTEELSRSLRRLLTATSPDAKFDCEDLALSFGLSFQGHVFKANDQEGTALVAALSTIFDKKMFLTWCKDYLSEDQIAASKQRDDIWYQYSLRKTGQPLFDFVQTKLGPVKFQELLEPRVNAFSDYQLASYSRFSQSGDKTGWCLDFFDRR